jgi:hypothetical protein
MPFMPFSTHDAKPPPPKLWHISNSRRTSFLSKTQWNNTKEKAENMSESRAKELDQEVLGFFRNSFSKKYEKWKRKDLILIALQTMPKQVKTQKLFDNMTKLKIDFENRLNEDQKPAETKPTEMS